MDFVGDEQKMESEELFMSRDVRKNEEGAYILTFRRGVIREGNYVFIVDDPYSEKHLVCHDFFSNLDAPSLLTKGRMLRMWSTQGNFVHEIEVWIENDENVIEKETKKQLHGWVPVWSCILKNLPCP